MICKNCGKEIFEYENKCPFCGIEIKDADFKKSTSLEGGSASKKKTSKKILISIIAVVLAVAIVIGTILIVDYHKFKKENENIFAPATVSNIEVTEKEVKYYYHKTYCDLVESALTTDQLYGAGYYKAYQGFDYSVLPAEQSFPNNLLPESETKIYRTWHDYIMEQTIAAAEYLYALESEAKKAGVSLTEEEKSEALSELDEMKDEAYIANHTFEEYLSFSYGSGIKEEDIKTWLLRDALARKYAKMKYDEIYNGISNDDLNAEYEKNKLDYAYADFRLYVFSVDTSAIVDGTSQSQAEVIRTEAEAKAKQDAEAFMNSVTTEAEFIAAAEKLDSEKFGAPQYMQPAEETTKFEKAQYSIFQQAFGDEDAKWAMDSARKVGDKKIMAYKQNDQIVEYYIVFVTKSLYKDERTWESTVRKQLTEKLHEDYEEKLCSSIECVVVNDDKNKSDLSQLKNTINETTKEYIKSDYFQRMTQSFIAY